MNNVLAHESDEWIKHVVSSCGNVSQSIRSNSPVFQDWTHQTLQQWKAADKQVVNIFSPERIAIDSTSPHPEGLQESWIHPSIQQYVTTMNHHLSYGPFKCGPKTITLHITLDNDQHQYSREDIKTMFRRMIVWFFFITPYATRTCNKDTLHVYVYMTPFAKHLDTRKRQKRVIGPLHCNSGMSDVCGTRSSSEIVVFRSEEWLKVLMHETFHNFGLDFSSDDKGLYTPLFHKRFGIPDSEYMLCETYTDMWARLIHVSYVAYLQCRYSPKGAASYTQQVEFLLFYESLFSLYQAVRVLDYFGLSYSDLPDKGYKFNEQTNVFAYYICTALWMTDPVSFIEWCEGTNPSGNFYQSAPGSLVYIKQFAQQLLMRSKRKSMHQRFEDVKRSCQWNTNTLRMSIIDLAKMV